MKITKSELKSMIREALREELHLRESENYSTTTDKLTAALDKAVATGVSGRPTRVLITSSKPGVGVIARCKAWEKAKGIKVAYITAKNFLYDSFELDRFMASTGATAVLIDEFERVDSNTGSDILSAVAEYDSVVLVIAYCARSNTSKSSDFDIVVNIDE